MKIPNKREIYTTKEKDKLELLHGDYLKRKNAQDRSAEIPYAIINDVPTFDIKGTKYAKGLTRTYSWDEVWDLLLGSETIKFKYVTTGELSVPLSWCDKNGTINIILDGTIQTFTDNR